DVGTVPSCAPHETAIACNDLPLPFSQFSETQESCQLPAHQGNLKQPMHPDDIHETAVAKVAIPFGIRSQQPLQADHCRTCDHITGSQEAKYTFSTMNMNQIGLPLADQIAISTLCVVPRTT